jgi:anhydro-N-acetylmuramic acid kinase
MDCKDTLSNSDSGTYKIIGLMSGTSLDGLDVAVCEFTYDSEWRGSILEFRDFNFPKDLRVALSNSMDLKAEELWRLDKAWAEFSAECVSKMSPDYLPLVQLLSSHGHTVFHNPNDGYSVQIGSGAVLAARTNLPVVCDLRSLDIAYGGQGAPLVPLVDKTLFSEYDACLNLGGFANISRLPKAWDIGVCNNLLNKLAREKGLEFDSGGSIAESGIVIQEMLQEMLRLEYHKRIPPKSLGQEWVQDELYPILERFALHPLEDRLRTSVEYIALTIVNDCPFIGKILVTGGGAFNSFLIKRLNKLSPDVTFYLPENDMINGKEAYAFAFLGLLRWLEKPTVIKSTTGAIKESSGGAVWLP